MSKAMSQVVAQTGEPAAVASATRQQKVVEVRPSTPLARGEHPWPTWGVAALGLGSVALVTAYLVWRHWPSRRKRGIR